MDIDPEEMRLVRAHLDACIAASRAESEATKAEHELTLYRMKRADPDEALRIAYEYAERRGFPGVLEKLRGAMDPAPNSPDA